MRIDGVKTASMSHKQLTARLAEAAKVQKAVQLVIEVDNDDMSHFAIGDQVEAVGKDGSWLPGVVTKLVVNGPSRKVEVEFDGGVGTVSTAPENVRLNDNALPEFWVAAYVAGGEKYYYNTVTNATSWDFPAAGASSGLEELGMGGPDQFESNDLAAPLSDDPDIRKGQINRSYAGFRIRLSVNGGSHSLVYGGKCDFGAGVEWRDALVGPLYFDPYNPNAAAPFRPAVHSDIKGAIMLVERGDVFVAQKVKHCQTAGAAAVIIVNTDSNDTLFTITAPDDGSEAGITIPVTNVVESDGVDLIVALQEGKHIVAELEDIAREPPQSFFEGGEVPVNGVAKLPIAMLGRRCTVKATTPEDSTENTYGDGGGANSTIYGPMNPAPAADETGVIAFVGHNTAGDEVVGVATDTKSAGRHAGTVDHVQYFLCDEGYGVLCSPAQIELSNDTPTPVQPSSIVGLTTADIGRPCVVAQFGPGMVRFVGKHAGHSQPRVGIELDDATGKHDGSVGGFRYFKCDRGHGLLSLPKFVKLKPHPPPLPTGASPPRSALRRESGPSHNSVSFDPHGPQTADSAGGDTNADGNSVYGDDTVYGGNDVANGADGDGGGEPWWKGLATTGDGSTPGPNDEGGSQLYATPGGSDAGAPAEPAAEQTYEEMDSVPMSNIDGFSEADVGSRCTIAKLGAGTVSFVGNHVEKGSPRVGVTLDEPTGKNNGTVGGNTYFVCDDNHGALVVPTKVTLVSDEPPPLETYTSVALSKPVGISLDGTKKLGMFVSKVKVDSSAALSGKVQVNLSVLSVNAEALAGKTKKEASAILKAAEAKGPVRLNLLASPEAFAAFTSAKVAKATKTFKVESPLGMSFDGTDQLGFYATKIKPGSNAEKEGVKQGMKLLVINGKDTAGQWKRKRNPPF